MKEFSSFRDPSGFIFHMNGIVYRQINLCYQSQYDALMNSGLYDELIRAGFLVAHNEANIPLWSEDGYKVIRPLQCPYISYPYEWSFGQLRDAALVTLKAHRAALDKGMILKDASAYNIQFINGKALLIDTLSFDFYQDGMPWVAYGQFCRHFLAPLLLMVYTDLRLSQLMRVYIDGVPLDLAATLLRGKGGMAAKQHVVWHAAAVAKHGEDGKKGGSLRSVSMKKFNHIALIESLITTVENLRLGKVVTEWGDYYAATNYSTQAEAGKERLVGQLLDEIQPKTAWDLGANDGRYTRLACRYGGHAVAFDIDPVAVERNYQAVKKSGEPMLPLLLDLTNPSPAIGFANRERQSIGSRQKPDCIMMLAVIHHLAISNNLPLPMIAQWLADLSDQLIIEFVPKEDSQVQTLLATRVDIFPDYTQAGFEAAFGRFFKIERTLPIEGSARILYRMAVQ